MITENNTISDSLVEKIRKLLALASELNDCKEQAEQALRKAKALAVQHEIDLASIQVFQNKKSEEPIEKNDEISLGKRQSVCQKFISWLLQNHFNVRVIYSHGYDQNYNSVQKLVLIGKKSDIEIATYVQAFLNEEFMRLWHNYRHTYQMVQTKDRNSFLWGLYTGLSDKLTESKKQAEQDGFAALAQDKTESEVEQVKECMSLTVVSDKERIEEAVGKFFPRLSSRRHYTSYSHSENARQAGERAGRQISLRRGISGGSQSQLH